MLMKRFRSSECGGVAVSQDQLNLSAAPDLHLSMHDDEPIVFGRLKWMFPDDGRSFGELPSCDTYLGNTN